MAKILIIRFSAIGDVAMTIPIVYSLANQYPQHQITVLSRNNMAALFKELPSNVVFHGVDLKNEHKGFAGLRKLYQQIKGDEFDYIADFHDVLRTKFLRACFWLNGKKVAHIDKGRSGKKALTRPNNKKKEQQLTSFQRYANVLRQLGLPVLLRFSSIYGEEKGNIRSLLPLTGEKEELHWIGIAPFATHPGKIYPQEKMEEVVKQLSSNAQNRIFLFGGGAKEIDILSAWAEKYPSTVCIAGKLKWDTELALMSHLDVMVSMDSGNMHLASLVHTPVVSVWGATHPFAGFMGWGQSEENAVQIDLPCRPCSVFGNKPCYRNDYACLNRITPGTIVERIESIINQRKE